MAFKGFIFKIEGGKKEKKTCPTLSGMCGRLGWTEMPPAKSSCWKVPALPPQVSPVFRRHPKNQGCLSPGVLWPRRQPAWHPRSSGSPPPRAALTSLSPLPWVCVTTRAAPPCCRLSPGCCRDSWWLCCCDTHPGVVSGTHAGRAAPVPVILSPAAIPPPPRTLHLLPCKNE